MPNELQQNPAANGDNRLTVSELLTQTNSEPSALGDLGRSLAYSALQGPVDGVAQLIDGKADGDVRKSLHYFDAAQHAEFGSGRWLAQQVGSTVGSLVPVLLVHKGVSGALNRSFGARATLAMTENMEALTLRQQLGAGSLKAAESGLTGVIFSGALNPVKTDEKDFWTARGRNALVGGMTFSTLAGSTLGLRTLGQGSTSALGRFAGSEVGSAVISGVPAGLVSANAESLLSGKGFATAEQQAQSVMSFSLLGGGFAKATSVLNNRLGPEVQRTGAAEPTSYKSQGIDVDGLPLEAGTRTRVAGNLPEYGYADMQAARKTTLADLSEIKASEQGKSVLDQFRDSGLSITEKYRVLDGLARVREHYTNQRLDGKMDPEQLGNWIHTQGEFGRAMDVAKAAELSPAQKHDALLASMFADSVKNKGNFFTHHMDGAMAADVALGRFVGKGDFTRERLDGVVNSIREHQIGPPGFMSMYHGMMIKMKLGKLTPEQEASLGSLQKKMADPLNQETITTKDGATALKLEKGERDLLNVLGIPEWYVPKETNKWNAQSRTVINGDSLDNYYTPGGIAKITSLNGPLTDAFFQNRMLDGTTPAPDRAFAIGSARASGVDAGKLFTPEVRPLADAALANTEAAIARAKQHAADQVRAQGIEPNNTNVPFLNSDLQYPKHTPEVAKQWWAIHKTAADKRTPADQAFYDAHKYDGLSLTEISDFNRAKEIRDNAVGYLRGEQRLDGKPRYDYEPATRTTK